MNGDGIDDILRELNIRVDRMHDDLTQMNANLGALLIIKDDFARFGSKLEVMMDSIKTRPS